MAAIVEVITSVTPEPQRRRRRAPSVLPIVTQTVPLSLPLAWLLPHLRRPEPPREWPPPFAPATIWFDDHIPGCGRATPIAWFPQPSSSQHPGVPPPRDLVAAGHRRPNPQLRIN